MSGYECRIKISLTHNVIVSLTTECPIQGQIFYHDCAPCDGTCENPIVPCPAICRPGCACPRGQVIKDGKKCVNLKECLPGDINVILHNI